MTKYLKSSFVALVVLSGSISYSPAEAKGCVRGAVAGAVAGHYAHHHPIAGAMAGCAAGHYYYKHKAKAAARRDAHSSPRKQ